MNEEVGLSPYLYPSHLLNTHVSEPSFLTFLYALVLCIYILVILAPRQLGRAPVSM